MNPNDWVSYIGETQGGWEHGYCYQWTIFDEWVTLEVIADNMGMYTAAVPDLCVGAPNGYFSILFCKTLVTVDALIENLYMQKGVIKGDGCIRSEETDPVTGKPLLLINKDGIEAINGYFHGRIEANEGCINNMTAINLKTDGTLNGAPITEYARNHPASPLGDMNYPIGSIILVSGSYPLINQEVDIYINVININYGNNHYTSNIINNGYEHYKLPGRWVSSGGVNVNLNPTINCFLARRIS